jgi:hypothetical protein
MNQDDLDALTASGLKPIIIDENFDFNRLGEVLEVRPQPGYEEFKKRFDELSALMKTDPTDDAVFAAIRAMEEAMKAFKQ